jgi:hypothetical protein
MQTREAFLRKVAGGTMVATAATGLVRSRTAGASVLDGSFTSPYPPYPTFQYPSSWYVYTALIPGVIEPFDVVFSNRRLGPLPDIDGLPDMGAAPSDATVLVVFSEELPYDYDISRAIPLNGSMRFNDLGGGMIDKTPGGARRFQGWWAARTNSKLFGFNVFVFVGRSAGPEWADVRGIVDSIQLPAAP